MVEHFEESVCCEATVKNLISPARECPVKLTGSLSMLINSPTGPNDAEPADLFWYVLERYARHDSRIEVRRVENQSFIDITDEEAIFHVRPCRWQFEDDTLVIEPDTKCPSHILLLRDKFSFIWEAEYYKALAVSIGGVDEIYGIHMLLIPIDQIPGVMRQRLGFGPASTTSPVH
ncbi:hypothetical protein IKG29_00775 [Candidatus Saccharibacteria bacterium]|nr:hypothetical protein [Candidatus Saccharibacteria bacterium]